MPWQPPSDYPSRLLCKGRSADSSFSLTEELYFRLPLLESEEEDTDFVPPGKISSLPFSVNREKYSKPADVIYSYPDYGIAMIRVQDVPPYIELNIGSRFGFRVEHLPVSDEQIDNYAHSEIKVFKDGVEVDHKDVPRPVKLVFRNILSARAKLFRHPGRKPVD